MPLRDDLLTPIEGENPSGPDLRYDKVFLQIEEARAEDDESLPSGDWGRTAKKADRVLVIKLAGDLLAKRTKDLRIAGWYLESLVRREGFAQLAGGIDLLWKLQTEFWDTIHPAMEEDGNLDLRVSAVEKSALFLVSTLKTLPLTRSGITWIQYQDATAIGFEEQATTQDRITARNEAIAQGALTGEDLQKGIEATPKAFYIDLEMQLVESLSLLEQMDEYQQSAYGDDYPSVSRLKSTLEALKFIASTILVEKRKTDPDPEPEAAPEPEPEAEPVEAAPAPAAAVAAGTPALKVAPGTSPVGAPRATPAAAGAFAASAPDTAEGASERVLLAAEFLQQQDSDSAVPYLLCSALRLGETRTADLNDVLFNVAPSTETRQGLRRLAAAGRWDELLRLSLRALTEPCGRVWLDLQRYIWRAAEETSRTGISTAVTSQIRALLTDVPELRNLMMDDDTPAANTETRQWLDEIVLSSLSAAPAPAAREPAKPAAAAPARAPGKASAPPDIFETAQEMLNGGRTAEAVSMLLRDSEQQPSGRMRFLRRVQVAQICLTANQFAVAYPMLRDLSAEIEKRTLESWEAAEMLSTPLSLYLRCLVQRDASSSEREEIFERLCRLDPQAALLAGITE